MVAGLATGTAREGLSQGWPERASPPTPCWREGTLAASQPEGWGVWAGPNPGGSLPDSEDSREPQFMEQRNHSPCAFYERFPHLPPHRSPHEHRRGGHVGMRGGHGRLQAGREASPETTAEQREESAFQLRRLWCPGTAPRA